ncbi:uncharacterized protein DUF3581 [Sinobacterium caligoides]|uniref:Uncharacterized protein DUF3581 n=2 Tax=Sinobacterium caligoides TaxID=933926 RepID=A0A3N2DK98_9GAMM|nr:uncharacterized protein DUF3581 [Sinobacterium caligoides]
MFINEYCDALDAGRFSFSRQQSSRFAKEIANDFNPIHDVSAKRFCVPGDLLFAKVLASKGLSTEMKVTFGGMVPNDLELEVIARSAGALTINDLKGKEYLAAEYAGDVSNDQGLIEKLTRSYVAFSGKTFPHVLVPLMKENNVMINVARPLVIYESMSVQLDTLALQEPILKAAGAELSVNGKRGNVTLHFQFEDQGKVVGKGSKCMVMANLRAYEQADIDQLIVTYNEAKASYQG